MNEDENEDDPAASDARAFAVIIGGMALTLLAGLGFSFILTTPIMPQLALTFRTIFFGIAATMPLGAFLYWFMRSNAPSIVKFRDSQIEFFSQIGFEFTPSRIALMAIGAGVTEELLFRGVFQTWLAGFLPAALAIILPNLVFGLLQARTALYAAIAGLVGCYLGLVFWASGNLVVPVVAHALYDVAALELTRRSIAARHA
ncbi:MAG: CPBP family intramembrane glutamic endopeptidase [Amphiplicatus sp.]